MTIWLPQWLILWLVYGGRLQSDLARAKVTGEARRTVSCLGGLVKIGIAVAVERRVG